MLSLVLTQDIFIPYDDNEFRVDVVKGMKKNFYKHKTLNIVDCPSCYIQVTNDATIKSKRILSLIPTQRIPTYPYVYIIAPLGHRLWEYQEYELTTKRFIIIKDYEKYLQNVTMFTKDSDGYLDSVGTFGSLTSIYLQNLHTQKKKIRNDKIEECNKYLELGIKIKKLAEDQVNENVSIVSKRKLHDLNKKIITLLNGGTINV